VAKLYNALHASKTKEVLTAPTDTGSDRGSYGLAAAATGSPCDYPLSSRFDANDAASTTWWRWPTSA
jgi:aromatic ring hydroxylase